MVSEHLLFLFRHPDKDVDDRKVFSPSGLELNLSRAGNYVYLLGHSGVCRRQITFSLLLLHLEGLVVEGTVHNKVISVASLCL